MKPLVRYLSHALGAAAVTFVLAACGGGDAEPPPAAVAAVAPPASAPGADTTAPTVTIADDTSAVTATGPVTFTFVFSEDVGVSFGDDDIVITGGARGAFTRVSGAQATLVVTPAASSIGTINVSVAALRFSDIAGNGNSATAASSQAFDSSVPLTQMALPVNFNSATVAYGFIGFGGAEDASVVVDPTDAANKVAKVVRAAGAEVWAGTTITAAGGLGFTPKIPFNANDTRISVRIWSPDAGIPVRLKVEDHADNTKSVETEATTTTAAGWQTLTFNFSNHVAGTAALNLAYNYDKASIFFDFGRAQGSAVQKTYYFDDVTFVPGAVVVPPVAGTGTVLASFDESPALAFLGFDGAESTVIAAGPAGGSGNALKIVRSGGQVYAGAIVTTAANVPFTTTAKTITARVWSSKAGAPFALKMERAGGPDVEVAGTPNLVANTWQTVTWVFTAVNVANSYNKLVFLPDLGTVAPAGGDTYYVDNVTLVTPAPPVAGPAGAGITFDDVAVAYTLTDFGLYGTPSAIVADPAGGTNKVVKVFKYLVGSEQWGGTTVSTAANLSIATIPFTASRTTMTLRVYSPAVGVRVRLKVENAGNPGINVETDAFTTTSGAWETLSFNHADPSTHYIPNGPSTYNLGLPTSALNVANVYNKASIFFDFGRGAGGYAPMVADRVYYFDDLALAP